MIINNLNSKYYVSNNQVRSLKEKRNNIAFRGNISKFLTLPGTELKLSNAAKLNKETLNWLHSHFKNNPQSTIKKVYNSCLNSDNKISEHAISLLKKHTPHKSILGKMFDTSNKKSAYEKFGLDFMAEMLESSKNASKNHTKENLDFLDVVLEKYDRNLPSNMLYMITNSKVKNGEVLKGQAQLFEKLYQPQYAEYRNDDLQYWDFMKQIKDKSERAKSFIVKNVIKKKNSQDLFDIVSLIKGKDSDKFFNAIDADLEKYDTYNIKEVLRKSYDYNGEIRFNSYKSLVPFANSENKVFYFYAKDKKGNFIPEAVELVDKIIDKADLDKVSGFMDLVKNKDGSINKDSAKYLSNVFLEYSSPSDFNDINYCVGQLKNKRGVLQYHHAKTLTSAWRKFCFNIKDYRDKEMFPDIVRMAKDNDGNFIPEILNALPNLFENGCAEATPNILKLSKFNGRLKKENFDKVVNILKSQNEADRKDLSKFLLGCIDENNNIDESKVKIFDEIKNCGVYSNVIKIATALQNPNKTLSQRGLNFVKDLRKNSSSDLEKDLPNILINCRDKSGYLNQNTMDTAKSLQKLNNGVSLSKLVKSVLDLNKEVDIKKVKIISEILKTGKINSSNDIQLIIKYSTDKNDVVDAQVLKRLTELSSKGENLTYLENSIPAFKRLYRYENVTSLNQLSLSQKRNLMQSLELYKNQITSSSFARLMSSKILPKNDTEYCSTMGRLSHSIGINTSKLSQYTKNNYHKAMDNLADKNQGFVHLDFDINTPKLDLSYPLKNFKQDVWNLVKDKHYSERIKALDYFGFELRNSNGQLTLTGYPNTVKLDEQLARIKDINVANLIKKINPLVIKFTQNNTVILQGHPNISKNITEITKAFPEFLTTVGKEQHGTHDFTLDVHTLKVLQEVFKNPEYEKLPEASKQHIQIAALMHDITKAEGRADADHPKNSGFDTYYLLDKLGYSEKDKLKVYHIIKNHDWLAKYDFSKESAKRIAFNLRENNAFKLCSMLTEADLKGVQKNDRFYLKHADKLAKAKKNIKHYIYDIQSSSIHLPQTNIPKASELNPNSQFVRTIYSDGIKNTVLSLKGCNDLEKAGFKSCKDLKDFNVLVHGLDSKNSAYMFQALGLIDSKAVLSSSYVNYTKGNYKAFRNEGFVLDVPDVNTHVAYWRDFGSGYKKDVNDLLDRYLFSQNDKRNYIPNYLKCNLHLSDNEYIAMQRKLEDMSLEKIEKIEPKVANTYRTLFKDMGVHIRAEGRNYNEILISNPKIQAIFCYNKKPEVISSYLRRYAERNDIPIVVFG